MSSPNKRRIFSNTSVFSLSAVPPVEVSLSSLVLSAFTLLAMASRSSKVQRATAPKNVPTVPSYRSSVSIGDLLQANETA